jgi:type II restriction/modification system DNA methylase subunit YeeA
MAWQDRPWILDGAAVRVSIIGIDDGSEKTRFVNGSPVLEIHADLSSELNVADAEVLSENAYIGFKGLEKNGSFELTAEEAFSILPLQNPHKLPNSLVVKPWMNASDVTGRDRAMWLVDFGVMSMSDACMFEAPFELVKARVMPLRLKNKDPQRREFWWRPGRSGGDLRQARAGKKRLIVTPRVAKHRLFVWIGSDHIADSRLYVFARDDDYFFGILHSRIHEVWSLANCSWHGDGAQGGRPTYNATSCFETFPFPWPPGREPKDSALTESVAAAARSLVEKRDTWLNPPNANRSDLSQRTLTNLYNNRPQWLQHAHAKLDVAVAAAYGWPADLSTQEILERVLALNAERASKVDFGTKKKPVRSAPSLPSAPATALSRRA